MKIYTRHVPYQRPYFYRRYWLCNGRSHRSDLDNRGLLLPALVWAEGIIMMEEYYLHGIQVTPEGKAMYDPMNLLQR